jgi:uroporphyrinogen-III synthase
MLSDAEIDLLFRVHTNVSTTELASYTEPELVVSETPDECDALVWTAPHKLELFLHLWKPTGKPR